MSKKGRTTDFSQQKQIEIYQAFRKVLESAKPYTPVFFIAKKAVRLPCSRFWISPEQAAKTISAIRRNIIRLDSFAKHRQKMFSAIIDACNNDFSLENIQRVILSPAPHFFITPCSALVLFYKHLNSNNNKPCNKN